MKKSFIMVAVAGGIYGASKGSSGGCMVPLSLFILVIVYCVGIAGVDMLI